MAGTRIAWVVALVGPMMAGAALAEERTFTCPVDGFTVYRDRGLTGALEVVVRGGDPGSIELHGLWGDIALPAGRVVIDGTTVFAEATGPASLRMPDRDAVDACIAEQERQHPGIMRGRRDADVLRACKDAAALSEQPAAVNLKLSIVVMQPPRAQAIITRTFADEAAAAAELHGVQTMAACTVEQP